MEYELVMGLEIHLQLNTEKKMFCSCKNDPFGAGKPNIYTCPVCLGLPGALPVPNKKGIKKAQLMAYALGSNLQKSITFERKNYFYPDLPKGYQITCPHYPISKGGKFDVSYWCENNSAIRFREIHLEEDTAKSMYKNGETLIDFNKSGVPLLEIVTEPDFSDIEVAVDFCKEVQRIARAVGVSEANMEKGHMRLEANVSIRKKGDKRLPSYRVELKNINSFRFMKKAVECEYKRQKESLEKGEKLYQETRGYDEHKGVTFVQRSKEEANDYRYFPEPDIPRIEFDDKWLSQITTSKLQLPQNLRDELIKMNLKKNYIDVFIKSPKLLAKYRNLIKLNYNHSLIRTNAVSYNLRKQTCANAVSYNPNEAANLVINIASYSNLSAKEIDKSEKKRQSNILNSEDKLAPVIKIVIQENKNAVLDYKSGKKSAIKFILGQVMKKTKGKADAKTAERLIVKTLETAVTL